MHIHARTHTHTHAHTVGAESTGQGEKESAGQDEGEEECGEAEGTGVIPGDAVRAGSHRHSVASTIDSTGGVSTHPIPGDAVRAGSGERAYQGGDGWGSGWGSGWGIRIGPGEGEGESDAEREERGKDPCFGGKIPRAAVEADEDGDAVLVRAAPPSGRWIVCVCARVWARACGHSVRAHFQSNCASFLHSSDAGMQEQPGSAGWFAQICRRVCGGATIRPTSWRHCVRF